MELIDILRIADDAYPDGMVLAASDAGSDFDGDTLALFIARELIETFDIESDRKTNLQEALRRMEAARAELDAVVRAFTDALDENPSDDDD